jgi:hypothetical protein
MKAVRVLCIVPLLVASAYAQQPTPLPPDLSWGLVQSIGPDLPGWQPGSPLQIIGVGFGKYDMANVVELVNVSEQKIAAYQLGWVVTDRDKLGPGRVFLGRQTDAYIKPMGLEIAGPQGATFSSVLEALKADGILRGKVVVGVIYAKLEDGTEWRYPLVEVRQFASAKDDTELHRKLDPIIRERIKLRASKPSAQAGCSSNSGLLQRAIASIRSFFSLRPVFASGDCVLPVCNPGPRQCDSIPGGCMTTYCPLDGCNWMMCEGIPFPCPQ